MHQVWLYLNTLLCSFVALESSVSSLKSLITLFMIAFTTNYLYHQSSSCKSPIINSRWLRCLLCREFTVDSALLIWDSIFASVPLESLKMLSDSKYDPLSQEWYMDLKKDPLYFMEFVSLAMIESIRSQCILLLKN